MSAKIYDTCIVPTCAKPLGQESKDLDYRVCQEHRVCPICAGTIPPSDIRWAHDKSIADEDSLDLMCARCRIGHKSMDPQSDPTLSVKQSYYDWLNSIRLMVEPNMELSQTTNENNAIIQSRRVISDMTWDQKYDHLKMLEACVANVSLALAQDRKQLQEKADAREREKKAEAKLEAKTSSRPVAKDPHDESEILLAAFMEKNGIKDRKAAMKLKRDRDKAIIALVNMGVPENAAQASVDKDLVKQGLLKK